MHQVSTTWTPLAAGKTDGTGVIVAGLTKAIIVFCRFE
jgi:hypothetical protein